MIELKTYIGEPAQPDLMYDWPVRIDCPVHRTKNYFADRRRILSEDVHQWITENPPMPGDFVLRNAWVLKKLHDRGGRGEADIAGDDNQIGIILSAVPSFIDGSTKCASIIVAWSGE